VAAFRTGAGLIAAMLVLAFGGLLLPAAPPLGIALLLAGGGIAVWQARRILAARPDPYDLSRLWEREPDPPSEAEETNLDEDNDILYCHSCGHAVPTRFHRCPDCGRPLT
jgi:hypothetical protein